MAAASEASSPVPVISASTPSVRYSRNTGRSLVTTGRSLASASSTARPQPSFVDGNASASAARYQPGRSVSLTVPSCTTSSPSRNPTRSVSARHSSRYAR